MSASSCCRVVDKCPVLICSLILFVFRWDQGALNHQVYRSTFPKRPQALWAVTFCSPLRILRWVPVSGWWVFSAYVDVRHCGNGRAPIRQPRPLGNLSWFAPGDKLNSQTGHDKRRSKSKHDLMNSRTSPVRQMKQKRHEIITVTQTVHLPSHIL